MGEPDKVNVPATEGKRRWKGRAENKAETSRKGGEGKQEMIVLKLDGEWGQGELIWCSPLGRNSHWSCYQTWPGDGGRIGIQTGKQGKRGITADLQHPKLLREVSPGPKGGQPCCPQVLFHPLLLSIAFSLGHTTQRLFVKSMSCVYGSAPCLTVSNQFLQVIPNYMLLVTAHKKLMKPLPSIKCNFCVLRGKRGRPKTKSPNFPLALAWLWGTASPSCPRFERFGAEGTMLCMKYAACNGGAKDMHWRASLPLKPWAFKLLQILTRLLQEAVSYHSYNSGQRAHTRTACQGSAGGYTTISAARSLFLPGGVQDYAVGDFLSIRGSLIRRPLS